MHTFKLGEFFSGAGGIALGAKNAVSDNMKFNISHEWAVDNNKDACTTYSFNLLNNQKTHLYCKDVRKIKIEALSDIDAFAYGFPCNSFSILGKHLGIDDEKYGNLYLYGVKVLNHHKPKFFLAENVNGIQSTGNREHFNRICNDLKATGYHLNINLYKFEEYGIPQKRHRIIIVGIRNDLFEQGIEFKVPSTEPYKDIDNSAGTALAFIPADAPNHEIKYPNEIVKERMSYIKPGENIHHAQIPQNLKIKALYSNIYRKLDPREPANTVIALGGGGTKPFIWYNNVREITNREMARLQTFPDDFIFIGNSTSVRKQIGMAVPPKGAEIIFKAILNTFAKIPYPNVPANISEI